MVEQMKCATIGKLVYIPVEQRSEEPKSPRITEDISLQEYARSKTRAILGYALSREDPTSRHGHYYSVDGNAFSRSLDRDLHDGLLSCNGVENVLSGAFEVLRKDFLAKYRKEYKGCGVAPRYVDVKDRKAYMRKREKAFGKLMIDLFERHEWKLSDTPEHIFKDELKRFLLNGQYGEVIAVRQAVRKKYNSALVHIKAMVFRVHDEVACGASEAPVAAFRKLEEDIESYIKSL